MRERFRRHGTGEVPPPRDGEATRSSHLAPTPPLPPGEGWGEGPAPAPPTGPDRPRRNQRPRQQATPFDSALRVLALRDHSVAELSRKLKEKGFEADAVAQCLERLQELNYLDDARFARSFAESSIRNGRGYGARLKMELARRGVAEPTIRETLAELSAEYGESDVLAQTVERRFAGFDPETASDKEKRKAVAYLQRKGFGVSAILKALKLHSIY